MKVAKENTAYSGKLLVQSARLENEDTSFTRERVKREDAVAVLLLNTDTNKVILTRQFRYPLHDKTEETILEIVAGKIDGDEDPLATAIRETEEEVGYRPLPQNIQLLTRCFSSPGYTSEQFYIYYATVKNSDKVTEGGGLAEENEHIEVVEMDVDHFVSQIREGQLRDAKTYVAGLFMILNWR